MNNYRITFLHNKVCNYWGENKKGLQAESFPDFYEWHQKYYPLIHHIKKLAREHGIKKIWHFYEPFIEITWLHENKGVSLNFISSVRRFLKRKKITDIQIMTPADGKFADWYCENEKEREFGAELHAKCGEIVELFWKYRKYINKGKGDVKQVERTIHRLCNPLGINFSTEGKLCLSRWVLCCLFRGMDFRIAKWIYTKIFRQKY